MPKGLAGLGVSQVPAEWEGWGELVGAMGGWQSWALLQGAAGVAPCQLRGDAVCP